MSQNNRILIVDDNESIHEDFRKILCPEKISEEDYFYLEEELFGETVSKKTNEVEDLYELDFAFNGEQAYNMVEKSYIENKPYALIFIDVRMPPGLNGIETISRIWENYPDIEMVICSAYSDYSWEEIIDKLGKNDKLLFLKKPFDPIEVKQMTLSLIKKYNLNIKVKNYVTDLENEVDKRTKQLKAMLKELIENKDKLKQESLIKRDIEKYLEEENNILISILEKIDIGIINVDYNNNILFLNNKAEKIISKTKDLVIGQNISNILKIKDKNDKYVSIEKIDKDDIYKLENTHISIDFYKIDKNFSEVSTVFFIREMTDIFKIKDIIKIVNKNIDSFLKTNDDKYINNIKSFCETFLNKNEKFNIDTNINKKILICDSSIEIAKLLEKILNELNFDSKVINLEEIENTVDKYDFIILDYYLLLNKSKYELIDKINKINNHIKIIISIPSEIKDCIALPNKIDSIIHKPFDIENIRKSLYL